jgi:hypothetical protein
MTDIRNFMEFHERANADTVEALDGDGAGVLWTIPPCSPEALKQALRQLTRCKATRIRWTRKVRLNSRKDGPIDAIGIYLLPGMEQRVYRQDTGKEIETGLLMDECVAVAQAMAG